jgi:hypothetical protein
MNDAGLAFPGSTLAGQRQQHSVPDHQRHHLMLFISGDLGVLVQSLSDMELWFITQGGLIPPLAK